MYHSITRGILFALSLTCSFSTYSQLKTSRLFSDGMVLQRDAEVPVWGWGDKGEKVTVEFNGQKYTTKADRKGAWKIILSATSAGGPYSMKVTGKKNTVTVKNILAGDVWLCSGQSNMEWRVKQARDAEQEIAAANDPQIRHFKVPHSIAETPQNELEGGEWAVCSPETVEDFTAVGYYFARELRKYTQVPIGLLNSSWGGSRIEPWMDAATLGYSTEESILEHYKKEGKAKSKEQIQKLEAKLGPLPTEEAGMKDGQAVWAAPDLDESTWSNMTLPGLWEDAGYRGIDGVVWFRTTFELDAQEAKNGVTLGLGKIDDSDISWINGQQVGSMEQAYDAIRAYEVKADLLKAGVNTIAVRVNDTGGGGGIYGDPALLYVKTATRNIPLNGEWKFRIDVYRDASVSHNRVPTILYNKMIHPIISYPLKGVIWYQGESNASMTDALVYRELFPKMIKQWRRDWNIPNLPFLYVQLANFMEPDQEPPAESGWALLRESQLKTLSTPYTGQAVIIDIGEADDIHPRNKQDVGYRLALAARKIAYGEKDVVYSGPVYRNHSINGKEVAIEFNHLGGGLKVKDKYGYINSFALAGQDRKFHWAKARLEGNKVVVWSDRVPDPVAVRYAWGNNPDDANLYNVEGLPASPFRTDDWQYP